ncbi:hypothetical protein C8R45DRAFT_814085, partial [Mycena sanguinolenta]
MTRDKDAPPAPVGAKFVGATKLRRGAAVLHMNSEAAVSWLKANMPAFLARMGGTAVYKERLYSLVVKFVPVTFNTEREGAFRVIEDDNALARGALVSARWIKPIERRNIGQKCANIVLGCRDAGTANRIIHDGVWIDGSKVPAHKLLTEPIRCMRCQDVETNHIAAACTAAEACARCGEEHRTDACTVGVDGLACVNCKRARREYKGHGAASRTCPFFQDKLQYALERNPEAAHPFYLAPDDPGSW